MKKLIFAAALAACSQNHVTPQGYVLEKGLTDEWGGCVAVVEDKANIMAPGGGVTTVWLPDCTKYNVGDVYP